MNSFRVCELRLVWCRARLGMQRPEPTVVVSIMVENLKFGSAFRVSDFRCQVSCFRFQVSGLDSAAKVSRECDDDPGGRANGFWGHLLRSHPDEC